MPAKNKQPKKAKYLPKAEVGFESIRTYERLSTRIIQPKKYGSEYAIPVALIPCRSQAAAKKLVKLFNMSEEERVEKLETMLYLQCRKPSTFNDDARAVLSALGLGGGK